MKLLLDTNAFYWFRTSPSRLPANAKTHILDDRNTRSLSVVSPWELAIKAAKGNIPIPAPGLQSFVDEALTAGMLLLNLDPAHIYRLQQLPLQQHRDPFDRILVAQALAEGMTLITSDSELEQYGVPILWS